MPFKTLADLQKDEDVEEDGSDNEYYAGGESSGQTIRGNPAQDPRRNSAARQSGSSRHRLVSAILDRARQQLGQPQVADAGSAARPSGAFHGTGYRLGDTESPGSDAYVPAGAPTPARTRIVTKTITFYRNGFIVDDGELRRLDDPAQAAFLADIHAGVVPRELEEPDLSELSVNLVDRSFEDYTAPSDKAAASRRRPFEGGGYRLGEAAEEPSKEPAATSQRTANTCTSDVVEPDDLDPDAPTTQVQVRLADGSRLVMRLNTTHRVRDLRSLVCSHRADYAGTPFVFQTVLPRRTLEEESQTLAEANLLNSVVVQQLQQQ